MGGYRDNSFTSRFHANTSGAASAVVRPKRRRASRPALAGLPCTVAETARAGLTSLFDVDSAARPGIVDALIRAEAMRTVILLTSGLPESSCYEETYISAGLSSIARGLFRVRL